MKKLALLSLLLAFAASVHGQVSKSPIPPGTTKAAGAQMLGDRGFLAGVPRSDADKLWMLGLLFSFIQNADSAVLGEFDRDRKFDDLIKDLSTDVSPEMADYKPVLEKLNSKDPVIRGQAARDFLRMVRKELDVRQTWQVDAGEELGLLVTELIKLSQRPVRQSDVVSLRSRLVRLSDLIKNAPVGVSDELKKKFGTIAAFAAAPDLYSAKKFAELMQAVSPLFDGI